MDIIHSLILLIILAILFLYMPGTFDNTCNILQWNCRAIVKNNQYLTHFLATSPITYDILCLQSLRTEQNKLPYIQGYMYPPSVSNTDNRVFTATYISHRIKHNQICSPTPNVPKLFYSNTVQIKLNGHITNIVNVYYPSGYPTKLKPDHTFSWISSLPSSASWIILGDFNCRHPSWDAQGPSPSQGADELLTAINNSNLVLLNDGSSTRYPDSPNQTTTAIDLTIASPNLLFNHQ